MSDLVKKTKVVPFINGGTAELPSWKQIKKSTTFTLSLNPQTKTFDFISSENPEEEIESYQPSLAQSITMFKGEDDYQEFFDMIFDRPTGESAHREILLAFYMESYSTTGETPVTYYKAWRVDSLVKLNNMDTVNESIDVDLSLNVITKGAVTVSSGTPTWVAGTWNGGTFTPAA